MEQLGQHQANDHQDRDRRVGHDVDHRRAHVVVAVVPAPVAVVVLLETGPGRLQPIADPQPHLDGEGVRLGDLLDALQETVLAAEGEDLPRAVRPHRLGLHLVRQRRALGPQAKARRDAVLEDLKPEDAALHREPLGLVVVVMVVAVAMSVLMAVMVMVVPPGAQQPGAGDVHAEPQDRDRNRLLEMDRHRTEDA